MGFPTNSPTQYSLVENFSTTSADNINTVCQHICGDIPGDAGSKDLTMTMPPAIGITPASVDRFKIYQGTTQLTSEYFSANGSISDNTTFTMHDGDCIINNVFIWLSGFTRIYIITCKFKLFIRD